MWVNVDKKEKCGVPFIVCGVRGCVAAVMMVVVGDNRDLYSTDGNFQQKVWGKFMVVTNMKIYMSLIIKLYEITATQRV